MNQALISLLKVKDLEYITVKEICQKAGVNRSTFYLHYQSIADLVNETMENVNQNFMSYFSQDTQGVADRLHRADLPDLVLVTRDYLHPYLRFVSQNKDLYRAAFRNPGEMQANTKYKYIKAYIVEPVLSRFGISYSHFKYYTSYYINGIMAIVKEWLNADCADPIETIADIIEACVRPTNIPPQNALH